MADSQALLNELTRLNAVIDAILCSRVQCIGGREATNLIQPSKEHPCQMLKKPCGLNLAPLSPVVVGAGVVGVFDWVVTRSRSVITPILFIQSH